MIQNMIVENNYGSVEYIRLNACLSEDMLEDGIHINHALGQAKISLYGGQVLTWQPKNEKPVLWLSDNAIFKEGKAIRGGVPICWPWFGPHVKDLTSPNHGFARTQYWQLEDVCVEEQQVKIILTLTGENEHPLWPHAFVLKQEIVFGAEFTQTLFIQNLSDETVKYTGALHSYFSVGDPEKVQVPALSPFPFDDKITGDLDVTSELENCKGSIDRIYYSNAPMELVDNAWQRKISLKTEYFGQWVLWNPGKEIASNMPDIHENGENSFVCLEAANTKWCDIPPQSEVYMRQTIGVSSK